MPDLLTHIISGQFAARLSSQLRPLPRQRLAFSLALLVGSALPDLLARAPVVLSKAWSHFPLDAVLNPLHLPIPYALVCLLLSRIVEDSIRRPILLGLLLGGCLHLLLDLGQFNIRSPYMLLFPFSTQEFQIGLYSPESSVTLLPALVAASLGLEAIVAVRRRRSS